ncbi:MAG TPA: protein kinase [Kofleriaceae bacterium]|nr:protein kinase [Kofleriaceae bacterium]
MTEHEVEAVLANAAGKPRRRWRELLEEAFSGDPVLVEQALLWLHAERDARREDAVPSLGEYGDERYELQMLLDRGATSTVWRAHDRKLGRAVAIKLLDAAAGFDVLREARAASDVISDDVVRILDVHEGEPSFIVMELVAEHDPERGDLVVGRPGSEVPARDVREVATWISRAARGIHDAHLRNVFHRDVKPRNLLITPISRKARVADFGLAISAASDTPGLTALPLIRSGPEGPLTVHGTPEYMAPEQARGLPVALDPHQPTDRATLVGIDVWGLGALAYSLLGGPGPWGPRGTGIAAWEKACSGERVPPLTRTARGQRIPMRFRRIIERCLELDPAKRYPTAAAVAQEVDAFLSLRPTTFDRTARARVLLWARRHRQLLAPLVAALVLLALVLAAQLTVGRLRGERDQLLVEAAAQRASLAQLHEDMVHSQALLDSTHQQLDSGRAELATLQAATDEERRVQQSVLQAKEQDLRAATAATRQLVEQLDDAKQNARAAQKQASLYESYWRDARKKLDHALGERDQLQQQRDALRGELERAQQEQAAVVADRDALRAALRRAQQQLSSSSTK